LFLSPKEFDYFLGMSRTESDELFAELVAHALQDRYVYRHHWHVDDVVAWDNRRFMHAATGSPIGDRRRGFRTTLAGDWVVGRLYVEAADSTSR
jgi:taurine dioxygenase